MFPAYLPDIFVEGTEKPPVIHVINEKNSEIVYSVRMKDLVFTPGVYEESIYTIRIENTVHNKEKTVNRVKSLAEPDIDTLKINF